MIGDYNTNTISRINKFLSNNPDPVTIAFQMDEFVDTFKMMPSSDKFFRYPEGYVIDEDKSVKWNREEVIRRNKEYEDEIDRLASVKSEALALFRNKMVDTLIHTYHLTKNEVTLILGYACDQSEAYEDVLCRFKEVVKLYEKLKNCKEEV